MTVWKEKESSHPNRLQHTKTISLTKVSWLNFSATISVAMEDIRRMAKPTNPKMICLSFTDGSIFFVLFGCYLLLFSQI